MNHAVIYPDESFLITKRSSGSVTFEFEGEIETEDKNLFLPESGNQILAKIHMVLILCWQSLYLLR